MSFEAADKVKVAVITGGHGFDVPGFQQAFDHPEIRAYHQHMNHFAGSPAEIRRGYDCVCFYHMLMPTPKDDGEWYEGQAKTALEDLGETEQGIFVLHHALLAYPDWPLWSDIVGIQSRKFGYHDDQHLKIEVAEPDHPITQGLAAWEMIDETYTMDDAGAGSEILLTVDHELSMKTIAWTRSYKKARVFCFESGHDNQTFTVPEFRQVLARGILWCAGRI